MNALNSWMKRTPLPAGVLALLLTAALPAAAATFTVNSSADAPEADLGSGICADASGMCTLRAAIMEANAIGGSNVIDLSQMNDPSKPIILTISGVDASYSGSAADGYTVTESTDSGTGALKITSSMDIVGAGPDKTIIEWSPTAQQGEGGPNRVFHIEAVSSNITVNISGVAIENGNTPASEIIGEPLADGSTYQFQHNGGGIAIGPAAVVALVAPAGSESGSSGDEGGGESGGDEGETSTATITGVTLTNVWIVNNKSGAAGGGISNAAPLTMNGVVLSGDSAVTNGGGIYNDAQLTVMNSTIGTTSTFTTANTAEGGGGLFDTGMHNTVIEESAINGNTATGGGGLSVRSMVNMDIVNTTIDGNSGKDVGGGITSNGTVVLQNDTIADNSSSNDSTSGGAGVNAFGKGT